MSTTTLAPRPAYQQLRSERVAQVEDQWLSLQPQRSLVLLMWPVCRERMSLLLLRGIQLS